MNDYYSTKENVASHPFIIAYNKIEQDKREALSVMKRQEYSYNEYVSQENRLRRLTKEQHDLLSIMSSDLTGDMLISKLKGEHGPG